MAPSARSSGADGAIGMSGGGSEQGKRVSDEQHATECVQLVTGDEMTTSDTSHDVPTPPQPRPGDTGTEAGMQPPAGLAEQPGGQENVPGGIGNVLASMGLRPWNALYIAAAVTFVFGLIVLVWPGATPVVLPVR